MCIVDGLARDKNIDCMMVLEDLEVVILLVIWKGSPDIEDVVVRIDPDNGDIFASVDGHEMVMCDLGWIVAQMVK